MSRRDKVQLIAEILTVCHGAGASKTQIVYRANLNFNNANSYLDLLTKKGLIEVIQGSPVLFKSTPNGERALESLRKIEAIYS
jgi:predicted transcriptional regulator